MSKFVDYDSYALENLQIKYLSVWITKGSFTVVDANGKDWFIVEKYDTN